MGLASIMPQYILQILGNDPGLKAMPLKDPELAQASASSLRTAIRAPRWSELFAKRPPAFSSRNF